MFKSDSQTNINTVDSNFSTVLDYIFIIKIILVENVREVLFVAYWVTIFPPKKMVHSGENLLFVHLHFDRKFPLVENKAAL